MYAVYDKVIGLIISGILSRHEGEYYYVLCVIFVYFPLILSVYFLLLVYSQYLLVILGSDNYLIAITVSSPCVCHIYICVYCISDIHKKNI